MLNFPRRAWELALCQDLPVRASCICLKDHAKMVEHMDSIESDIDAARLMGFGELEAQKELFPGYRCVYNPYSTMRGLRQKLLQDIKHDKLSEKYEGKN